MRVSCRAMCFAATAVAWAVSMGVLIAKEILPAVEMRPPNFFEEIFTRLLPYEEWWYGLYHDDALCGGLRIYYDMVEEEGSTKAVLRPSFWCSPLQVEGTIAVDARYRMESARWDLRWHGTRSVLHADVTSDGIDWNGNVGDQAIHLRFPLKQAKTSLEFGALLPLHFIGSKMAGGADQISCSLGTQEFHVSVWKDASGMVQRMDFPLAYSLRREQGKIALSFLKREGGYSVLEDLLKRFFLRGS